MRKTTKKEVKKIDLMFVAGVIGSLCEDIDLTKEICNIDKKKFDANTEIAWASDELHKDTVKAINKLLMKNGFNETFLANRELKTVEDAFRYISVLSVYALLAGGGADAERLQKYSLGYLVNHAGIGFSSTSPDKTK